MSSAASDCIRDPWPGLNAFTENLQPYFHGRQAETDELFRRVKRKPLTVLFGQSGLGKTSLLQAGLFPRLRQERLLPVVVRLDHSADAPALATQVMAALARAIEAADLPALPPAANGETLWEYFHRRDRELRSADDRRINVVLVFDQFEELFTLGKLSGKTGSRKADFLTELADLVENRLPIAVAERCEADEHLADQFDFERDELRVLLSLREDFLPHLESLRSDLPAVAENRMRLTRMNGNQALEAVVEPGREIVSPQVGRQIVQFVAGGQAPDEVLGREGVDFAGLEVEPALLSLFCRELNDRRIAQGLPEITTDLLAGSRAHILDDFYERCVADQPPAVREFVEDELLTDSGYRESMAVERARKTLTQQGAPADAIDTLVSRRLLHIEERLHVQRIELTHDLLVDVVKRSRTRRQQLEAARRGLRQWLREHKGLVGSAAAMVFAIVLVTAIAFLQVNVAKNRAVESENRAVSMAQTEQQSRQRAEAAEAATQAEKQEIQRQLNSMSLIERGTNELERGDSARGFALLGQAYFAAPAGSQTRVSALALLGAYAPKVPRNLLHGDAVTCVAFSPDGTQVLTGSQDKTARLWDAATGKPLVELRHDDTVKAVAFSPDGTKVLTGSLDKTARLWDAATGKSLGDSLKHHGAVLAVAFSPDGTKVLTGSADKTARLWNAVTGEALGEPLRHLGPVSAVAFSPDGTKALTGSNDGTARLWEVPTGNPLGQPLKHDGPVEAVAFSPDGTKVLTGDGISFEDVSGAVGIARLWDTATGKPLGEPLRHDGPIKAVAFSPDGTKVLTGSDDRTARLWSAATGGALGQPLRHLGPVRVVAFSPDGTKALTGSDDKTARLWDAGTGQPVGEPLRHDGAVTAAAFSADGAKVLTGSRDKAARLWNVAAAKPLGRQLRHDDLVAAVAFSPDGTKMLTGSWDQTAQLWDAATGRPISEPLRHEAAVWAVAYSADGTKLLTGGADHIARVWNAATGHQLGEALGHDDTVSAVAFSPDGTKMLTGSLDKTARQWDAATNRQIGKLQHYFAVKAVAFSPDGTKVLTGSADETARLWNAATGKRIGELRHDGQVRTVGFSVDGTKVITGGDDGARMWDAATNQPISEPLWKSDSVLAVALSPDGTKVLSGSDDHTARIWDAATGKLLGEPLQHGGAVVAVAFSPDGTKILTGSADHTATLWRVPTNLPDDPAWVTAYVAATSGWVEDSSAVLHQLSPKSQVAKWDQVAAAGKDWLSQQDQGAAWTTRLWHQQEAEQDESRERWFGAAFHLGYAIANGPTDPILRLRRARAYVELGQTSKAAADEAEAAKFAQADSRDARAQRELSNSYSILGTAHQETGELPAARKNYEQALSIRQSLAKADPQGIDGQRDLAVSYLRLGNVDEQSGNLQTARENYEQGLKLFQQLIQTDPSNDLVRRGLSFSCGKLGDIARQMGDLAGARDYYERGLKINEALAHDRSIPDAQRNLAVTYEKLGGVKLEMGDLSAAGELYEKSLKIFLELAQANPTNTEAQFDLSFVYERLGTVALRTAKAQAARDLFQKCLDIRRRLVQADPHNIGALQDLSFANHQLGPVLLQLGELPAAREIYEQDLKIAQQLAAQAGPRFAGAQRDLSIAYETLADVDMRSDYNLAAHENYEQSLIICNRLAQAAPHDAQAQRDLAEVYGSLGEVDLRLHNLPAARQNFERCERIAEQQVAAEPTADRERFLSVSYNELGSVNMKSGAAPAALEFYHKALKIRLELAQATPKGPLVRHDLAYCYEALGSVNLALGNVPLARENYQQCRNYYQQLAQADPQAIGAQTDLSDVLGDLGSVEITIDDFAAAAKWYEQGVELLKKLDSAGRLAGQPSYVNALKSQARQLTICQAAPRAIDDLNFALAQPQDIAPELLAIRGRALARRGKHADAVATADKLVAFHPKEVNHLYTAPGVYSEDTPADTTDNPPGNNLYLGAGVYSLCSVAVAATKSPADVSTGDKPSSDRYASRAIELLQRAEAAGFFHDADNRLALQYGHDFDPLRSRDDFKKLLAKILTPPPSVSSTPAR